MAIKSFSDLAPNYPISNDLYVPLNESPFGPYRFNCTKFSRGWGDRLSLNLFPTKIEYDFELINLPSQIPDLAWKNVRIRSALSFRSEPSMEELEEQGLKKDEEGYYRTFSSVQDYLVEEQMRLRVRSFFGDEIRKPRLTELEEKIYRWNPNEGILRRKVDFFGDSPDEKLNPIVAEVTGEYLFGIPSIHGLTLSFAPEMNTEKPYVGFRRYMGLDWYNSREGWNNFFGASAVAEGIKETQQILDKVAEIIA